MSENNPVYSQKEFEEKFIALHYALQQELRNRGVICRINTYDNINERHMNNKIIEIAINPIHRQQFCVWQTHKGEVFWEML